jgi:dynein assembly factor 3
MIDAVKEDVLDKVKIVFLPCDPTFTFSKKRKFFENSFDAIFISNSFAHRMVDAAGLLKPRTGRLIVETAK